ncbi:DUF190 domain-containing protein [Desulfobulbus alkaliphilus]|nr:DUF190 domain-containing protein [Desulfobulbus alkaliphilus]MBM9537916.1 DUF190 domain-containing protein [Desulfobulbus alkaliphilus]
MLNYKAIEIFTDEKARHGKKPVIDAVLHYIRGLKIAARCIVTRGIAGCDESGEMTTDRLEILSFNLPIRIYIIVPAAATDQVLAGLDELIGSGVIALHDLQVVSHKTASTFFPRQLQVRDVMTARPERVTADSRLSEAARLLLSSIFTGLPVVDEQGRPIGVITQGDLIRKGGLPLRLGLLSASGRDDLEAIMHDLAQRRVAEAMSSPPVLIAEERPLTEAVERMLAHDMKRLPVVDAAGRLVGMLSRLDIFRTVMREAPDWSAFRAQEITISNLRTVADILRRDIHTVGPETPLDKVIQIINDNDIQRVAVVNAEGLLLGLIADRDLLRYFQPDPEGLRYLLARLTRPFRQDGFTQELDQRLQSTRAEQVMRTDILTVREDMLIDEAVRIMTEKMLKRLPVVDDQGRFRGMISRDSLLRTGYGHADGRDQSLS